MKMSIDQTESLPGSSLLEREWPRRIARTFFHRRFYHVLLWFLLLAILTWAEGASSKGFWFTFTNELINVFFFAVIVYFNLLYLIPNYLTQKKFGTYALLLVLSAAIITPLKLIVFFFKFSDMPALQDQLLNNQFWHFLIMFFAGGISTLVRITQDWMRHLREKQDLQTQTIQSELRFLKSQINPHFLFNTLNNLYALTLKKSDEAPEIVIKLSEMMRYMLYECNEKRVPLKKEVNYLRNYLDLEKLRQGKNVSINFEVEGVIEDQEIAPLMFIPFLENSFKHGLNNEIMEGFVNIFMQVENREIHFFIENSKSASTPRPENRRSGGIGLVNVKRRLDLLYPNQYELTISDNPNSYAVNLEIKL